MYHNHIYICRRLKQSVPCILFLFCKHGDVPFLFMKQYVLVFVLEVCISLVMLL